MRILYAADSADLFSMEVLLGSHRFNVYSTDDADEAIDLGKLYDYDLFLLGDVMGAHRVLQSLRAAKVKTPILRLSRANDPVVALVNGADDFLLQPFQPQELVARIHAIVRRSHGHAASVVTCGPLVLNLDARSVSVAGKGVHLTGKEYAMLELMALRQGSLITKEMFLNHLYGGMDEPEIKIIDVFICKLRRKLLGVGGEGLVQTVWGRGYMLGAGEGAASLAPEVRDLMEDPRGYGFNRRTPAEAEALAAKKRFGKVTA